MIIAPPLTQGISGAEAWSNLAQEIVLWRIVKNNVPTQLKREIRVITMNWSVIPEVNCHWKPQRLRKLVPKLTRKVFSSKFQARYLILYSYNRLPGLKWRCWTRVWAIIQLLYDRCAFIRLCDNNASIWSATRCTEATVISLPWPEGENEWNGRLEPLLSEQLNLNLCRYVVLKYKKVSD